MTDFKWFIVIGTPEFLRTIHPPRLSPEDRQKVEAVILSLIRDGAPPVVAIVPPATAAVATEPVAPILLSSEETKEKKAFLREAAKAANYTGDECGTCGGFSMVRNGTCLKCETCGATTGCS